VCGEPVEHPARRRSGAAEFWTQPVDGTGDTNHDTEQHGDNEHGDEEHPHGMARTRVRVVAEVDGPPSQGKLIAKSRPLIAQLTEVTTTLELTASEAS